MLLCKLWVAGADFGAALNATGSGNSIMLDSTPVISKVRVWITAKSATLLIIKCRPTLTSCAMPALIID